MKISIITSPFGSIPPNATGAVEKLFYDLAQEFIKHGNEVTFYCCGGGEEGKNKYVHITPYKRSGSIKIDLVKDFCYSLEMFFKLTRTDILILNTFWSPILARFFKWKYKKVVYGVHRFPKGQFKYYLNMDLLICVSTAVCNALLRQTPQAKDKAVVIANPVNNQVFYFCKKNTINAIEIMYSGRIHPQKGLHVLVQAFIKLINEFPKTRLTFIGEVALEKGGGGETYRNDLLQLAKGHEIKFIPAVTNPVELAGTLSKADIFCYPSLASQGEAFPVAPLEAMALGIPVVVSDLECFMDLIVPNENALIFKRDNNQVESLVDQLKRLICDEALRQRLGKNAARRAREFATDKIANKYLTVFEKLMQK